MTMEDAVARSEIGVSATRKWRHRVRRALFESALIVFSVLLALGLNEWRDGRREAALSAAASDAVVAEMRRNHEVLERARDHHRSVNETLTGIASRGERVSRELAQSGLFRPATLVDTAWTSAQSTGAVDRWPYQRVLGVGAIYERQAAYSTLARTLVADLYTDLRRRGMESALEDGLSGMILLTQDFANREEELARQLDTALAAIEHSP